MRAFNTERIKPSSSGHHGIRSRGKGVCVALLGVHVCVGENKMGAASLRRKHLILQMVKVLWWTLVNYNARVHKKSEKSSKNGII